MAAKKIASLLTGPRLLLLVALSLVIVLTPRLTQPEEKPGKSPYVILSGEFFAAMEKLARSGVTYGDRQEPLLEQIALSSQFMVKTNLTLIQQNERIIQLLEKLNCQLPAPER